MTTKEEFDKQAKENIEILKRHGYIKDYTFLWMIFVFILGFSFLGLGYYAGTNDWFKSNVNQSVTLEPNITTNNNYSFETPIENSYDFKPNYTINNYVLCP